MEEAPFTEDDDDFVDEEEFSEDDWGEEDGTDCIFGSKEEWESFINSLSQDNYSDFDVEISYINMAPLHDPN